MPLAKVVQPLRLSRLEDIDEVSNTHTFSISLPSLPLPPAFPIVISTIFTSFSFSFVSSYSEFLARAPSRSPSPSPPPPLLTRALRRC